GLGHSIADSEQGNKSTSEPDSGSRISHSPFVASLCWNQTSQKLPPPKTWLSPSMDWTEYWCSDCSHFRPQFPPVATASAPRPLSPAQVCSGLVLELTGA